MVEQVFGGVFLYSYHKNERLEEILSRDTGCISVYKMGLNRWTKIIEVSLRDEFREGLE